ncbi:MAG: fluoride efflux transporter CrcB [Candidatus Kapaibacteriales bacterium]
MVRNIILVALGGALGAGLRYILSIYLIRGMGKTLGLDRFIWWEAFKIPTLWINLLSCLLIGLLYEYFIELPKYKLLLITGFLGGLSTFSAFGLESLNLFHTKSFGALITYILVSVLLGIVLVWLGYLISNELFQSK